MGSILVHHGFKGYTSDLIPVSRAQIGFFVFSVFCSDKKSRDDAGTCFEETGHDRQVKTTYSDLQPLFEKQLYFLARMVKIVTAIPKSKSVATSSFSATNLIIGATVGAVKSGGNPALFAKEFVLRINFVGLGRCAVAIGADVSSGIKKTKMEYQLGRVNEQIIALTNAKTYYCVGGIWKEIEDTEAATQELENTVVLSVKKAYDYCDPLCTCASFGGFDFPFRNRRFENQSFTNG